MGVYIKDMKMPKCCGDCHIGFCKQIGCELYIGFDNYATSRHTNCPIVEVPPHGRLIDADALAALCDEPHWCVWLNEIEDAPTIIEAEEAENDS